MAADDDGNASSSDTHGLLVAHDDPTPKKIEEVAVVNNIVHESPTFGSESAKDVQTVAESSGGPSVGTANERQSDVASVRSMPAVRTTESPVPLIQEPESAMPSPSPSSLSHRPPPSPSRSQTLQEPNPNNQQRRASRRSTIEVRRIPFTCLLALMRLRVALLIVYPVFSPTLCIVENLAQAPPENLYPKLHLLLPRVR